MKGRVYSRTKPIPEDGSSFRTTRCQGAPRSVLTWSRQLIAHTPPSTLCFAHCALHTAPCTLQTTLHTAHSTLATASWIIFTTATSTNSAAVGFITGNNTCIACPLFFGGLVDFSELKFDHEGAHKSWKMCLHVPTKSS